jgi:NADH:ubiquinone oxidoreductase subunit 3 (subunit A)
MHDILLSPPAAFIIFFVFLMVLSRLASKIAFINQKKVDGTGESYACGEDIKDHLAQPDYSQFFPYAFFFTLAHVAAMVITTVPVENAHTLILALSYICVIVVGLYILLRK